MSKKNYVIALVLLLVVIAIVLSIQKANKKTSQPAVVSQEQTQSSATTTQVKTVDNKALPSLLPTDIPLEAGATILNNYEATDPVTRQVQSTRVFVTAKTLTENFDLYSKYMQQNGWTVTSTINTDTLKSLSGVNGSSHLDITISSNSVIKQTTVSISMTEPLSTAK